MTSKKQQSKSKARRRQAAKHKGAEILRWYRKRDEALTREDLQHEMGLTAAEADAVYRYITKAERGYKEEFISEESGTHLWVPVNADGIMKTLLDVGKATNPEDLNEWTVVAILEEEGPLTTERLAYFAAPMSKAHVLLGLKKLRDQGKVTQDSDGRWRLVESNNRNRKLKSKLLR